MKIKAFFIYNEKNDLNFNQVIYQQFRASLWLNEDTFTAFEIEEISGDMGFILPKVKQEVILNVLDSSTAHLIKVGDTVSWGVPYKKVGEVIVIEVIVPCEETFFGSKNSTRKDI